MLVFDGSTSMVDSSMGIQGLPKIAEAQRAMARALPEIEDVRRIGLMIYGPQPIGDACEGISLRFLPIENSAAPILEATRSFAPGGLTPLTASVARAADVTAFPLIHEVYPAAVKKFQHSFGLKRSQISPIALMR